MQEPYGWRLVFSTLPLVLLLGSCGSTQQAQTESASSAQPAAPAGGGTSGTSKVDACSLMTLQDATALFGQPASPQQGEVTVDPNMVGECLWTWDTEAGNQLLQLRIWNGAASYGELPDSQPFEIGEKGYIRAHPAAGVDVEWVQHDRTISLSYSTVGQGVPKAVTKVEEIKTLARRIASKL